MNRHLTRMDGTPVLTQRDAWRRSQLFKLARASGEKSKMILPGEECERENTKNHSNNGSIEDSISRVSTTLNDDCGVSLPVKSFHPLQERKREEEGKSEVSSRDKEADE
jgi:hypothetical protein